jgi:large subunit ribosomal protein L23
MRDARDVILRPVVSEKSYGLLEANVYTFVVANDASKPEIHDAVESIFGVTVKKVNTLNRKGKAIRNRRTGRVGRRADVKRALVTLADGDSIDLFEG